MLVNLIRIIALIISKCSLNKIFNWSWSLLNRSSILILSSQDHGLPRMRTFATAICHTWLRHNDHFPLLRGLLWADWFRIPVGSLIAFIDLGVSEFALFFRFVWTLNNLTRKFSSFLGLDLITEVQVHFNSPSTRHTQLHILDLILVEAEILDCRQVQSPRFFLFLKMALDET